SAKRLNIRRILHEIYQREPVSRADLARATKLTRPTASAIVSELLDLGLVIETGTGVSTGGKRPTLLTVPDDAYHLLCVDLSREAFQGAIVNLRGDIVSRYALDATGVRGDAAFVLLTQLLDRLRGQTNRPILGIGIGSPGLVDPQNGVVRRALHLDWEALPLRQRLTERYGKSVYIANDSHVAALAEFMLGTSQQNVILIKVGQGIGAGIVWNGAMLTGDGFGAGEIGQVVVAEHDGQLMSLEQVASMPAIMREVRGAFSAEINLTQLANLDAATPLINTIGRYLGIAIANLIATLNIQQIVLAGPLIELGEPLRRAIQETARCYTLSTMVDETEIRFSTLGEDAVLQGCAALLLKHELGVL
ncbi:MAG: ROK family transcriptional regulator, partial [Candidatus Promineifilaceae bacterium]